jgi:hypothetical protein
MPLPLTDQRSLVLLAPQNSAVPNTFKDARCDVGEYDDLLAAVQRFRGATYLEDGAIREDELDATGRHRLPVDPLSWHVVTLSSDGTVCGCSRSTLLNPNVNFHNMAVGRSALAQSDVWGAKLKAAVESERRAAEQSDLHFAEVGGWAIAAHLRRTTEAIRIALATFALGQSLGGTIGLTTATVRHSSASVLKKIGGRGLVADSMELPKYFDPQYGCEMEVLRFNVHQPNPKFAPWVEQIQSEVVAAPVVSMRANLRSNSRGITDSYQDSGLQPVSPWIVS